MKNTTYQREKDMVFIDTYKLVEKFINSGFDKKQSEALSEVLFSTGINDLSHMKADIAEIKENMVTKVELKSELNVIESKFVAIHKDIVDIKEDISDIKENMARKEDVATKSDLISTKSDLMAIKSEFALLRNELKADIATIKFDIIKWMIPCFLTMIGFMIAVYLK